MEFRKQCVVDADPILSGINHFPQLFVSAENTELLMSQTYNEIAEMPA